MDLETFYAQVGGSYAETLERLRKDTLVKKYLGLFTKDESFAQLKAAVAASDWQACFAASHNLKGVTANLGLGALQKAASDICEDMRPGTPTGDVAAEFAAVESEYDKTIEAIAALD